MPTDIHLVHKIQQGDRHALEVLYARYLPILWRFAAARFPRNESAARDLTSETFLAAIRNIRTFNPAQAPVGAWLLGIARHKAADLQRLRTHSPIDQHDPAAPTSPDPLETAEARTAIATILDQLPDDQRLALELKYLDHLSIQEIAHKLSRTEKSIESLLFRAREDFRTRYQALLDKQERSQ